MKQVFSSYTNFWLPTLLAVLVILLLPLLGQAQSANIVISQVYAAGGNAGATYNQDFVELFNRSTTAVNIGGWSIQYAASSSNFSAANTYTFTPATIQPGGYYLVGIAVAGSPGSPVAADQVAAIGSSTTGLSATAGKVAIANNAAVVTYAAANVFSANAVDVVGYTTSAMTNPVSAYEGTAPAGYPTTANSATFRIPNGCTDTNNNVADFTTGPAGPHSSATLIPANGVCANPVLVANPSALTLSTTTGQVAPVATYTLAGYNLTPNAPITISSNNAAVLVSTTGLAGSFASTASTTANASGTLSQTISVQFTAPAVAGTTTAIISNSGNGLTASVAVTGAAIMAYTWNGTSTSFSNASSWTPARPMPLGNSDVLLFDGSVTPAPTVILDYTSSQTIGQMQFTNNVAATLNTDGNRLLTLSNNLPGDDFVIQAGSTVTVAQGTPVAATSALTGLTISLTNLETASISGTLIFTGYTTTNVINGRHTLQATDAEAIQFLTGSRFQAASTYTGANPFGTATTNAGSVIFRNGSRFEQAGGLTPFGTTTPAVTAFEPTSYFLFNASGSSPSLTGRTYGTLAYDITGSSSPTGSSLLTIQGDLLIINGTVEINVTGSVLLQGNVQVSNAARLSFNPASASTVQLGGTTTQTLSSTSTANTPIAFGASATLQINNAAGVTLGLPISVPGTLQLTSGLLTTTTTRMLTLPASATILYTVGSNASFVNGPVVRPLNAGGSYTFPIGKGASFRPFTLTISPPNSTTYYYRAEQFEGNPGQNIAGSTLTRVSIYRSFTVTPFATAADAASTTVAAATLPAGFSSTATLSFGSNDGVTDPNQLVVAKRPNAASAWTNAGANTSSVTATTITSGSFVSFSDFALGSTSSDPTTNPLPVTLTNFGVTRQPSGAVQVRWATASEQHSAYFEVQRSLDGSTFAIVDKVAAAGTTTQSHMYTSLDQSAPASQLYYRLRQVDTDAAESFSPVVTLAATEAATPTLYPNPAHSHLTLAAAAGQEVQVIDLVGRVLLTTTLPPSGKLNIEALSAGTYLLRAPSSSQQRVLRFTKE